MTLDLATYQITNPNAYEGLRRALRHGPVPLTTTPAIPADLM